MEVDRNCPMSLCGRHILVNERHERPWSGHGPAWMHAGIECDSGRTREGTLIFIDQGGLVILSIAVVPVEADGDTQQHGR
eukprot:799480-Prorocentrum_minimum.AAC.2